MEKRILMIGALGVGQDGMSKATIVLRDQWRAAGHPVDVVDFFDNGGSGVGVSQLNKILATFRNRKRAGDLVKKAATVYMTPKLSFLGFLSCITYFKMCIQYNVPYTLHFHGRAFQKNYRRYPLLRPFICKYIQQAACNIALTDSLKAEIEALGIGGNWVTVGNYAEDFMMLNPDELVEKKLIYQAKPVKISYLSNVIESKGIFQLMEAVSNDDRFVLHIAGHVFPEEKVRFDQLLDASKNIEYLGFVSGDEKREMLKSSMIFALPTEYPTEAQPISVIEALCMGCTIVSTTHIGIMDTLGENYPQNIFVKRDTHDVRERLIMLHDTEGAAGHYVLDHLQEYQQKFSVNRYADGIRSHLKYVGS